MVRTSKIKYTAKFDTVKYNSIKYFQVYSAIIIIGSAVHQLIAKCKYMLVRITEF